MRQYIRHPVDVPIEINAEHANAAAECSTRTQTHDISVGGLALRSLDAVAPGAMIVVRIPYVEPAFEVRARVAWCRPGRSGGHELGVTFLHAADAFLARMVEQVCYIADYRKSVERTEGRVLSAEDAAREWISKYASKFPGALHGEVQ